MSQEGGLASVAPWANRPAGRPDWALQPAQQLLRRGGRVVECTALEMRHTREGIQGSNPCLSARSSLFAYLFRPNVLFAALGGEGFLAVAFAVAGALGFAALAMAYGAAGAFFVER